MWISLVIKQSGVVIGEVKNVARDYVKAPYVAIANAPVIVMKSNSSASSSTLQRSCC